MITIQQLSFGYSGQKPLFRNFNLQIDRGEAWSIIGPSGCGKSTLLYLLAGLKRPTAGSISIAGCDIKRPRPQTGLVLQDHGLLPWASVRQNALLGITIRQFYGPDGRHAPTDMAPDRETAKQQVDYWLKWLGIDHLQNQYPAQLSRGQRQRTAIARTLALEPDLLLMDEPFSALDAPIRIELQNVMTRFHSKSKLTSVTVTHDIEEAVFLGHKILAFAGKGQGQLKIIENELAGQPETRERSEFQDQCRKLRDILGGKI